MNTVPMMPYPCLLRNPRLLAFLLAATLAGWTADPAAAVPACPEPAALAQPNGAKVQLHLRGDEFFSWHETADGYAVVKDAADGFWKFARPLADRAEFQAIPGARVGASDPARLGLKKHAMPDAKALRSHLNARQRTAQDPGARAPAPSTSPDEPPPTEIDGPPPLGIPVSGTKTVKNIVILASFSDHWDTANNTVLPANGRVATAEYSNLFNQINHTTDGAVGSVRDYYTEVSYGKLTVQSVITSWVKLPQTEAYYGANNASGSDVRPQTMAADAIAAAATAGFDFSQGDSDADGWVDGLTIIHSGRGEEYSGNPATCIWSHQWSMSSVVTKNAVKLYRYHTEPAVRGWKADAPAITRIGVICHEMGHFFGLPDLYDYSGTTHGLGNWCLMAGGSWNGTSGTRPAHFSAWPKCFLGFVNPVPIHSQTALSMPRVEDNAVVKLLRDGMSNSEYYLIENRTKTGFDNDANIYPGLLIYHVDAKSADNDLGTWPHPVIKIEEADGDNSLGAKTAPSETGDAWTSTSGLAGGFRDQTGNQNTNAMLYQTATYSRPDSATYYSYNTLSNFSAVGNPMTFNALTFKTSVGSQTSTTANYTVSWPACAQATQYEIQEGTTATLTSFSDGAEDEDAMYDNWYQAGTVKRDSSGKRTGTYSYAMHQYFSSKWGSSMQSLTMRKPFKVTSSTVVSFYLMSHLDSGAGYLKCQISNDSGNTWKTLGTYDGYIDPWSLRSYNYTAMNTAGIAAGELCSLRFVASFEQTSGWDTFPGYGYALDDISITSTEISGYSGWTTLASNVAATSYGITGKAAGIYAYRVRAYAHSVWQGYGTEGETTVNLPQPPSVTINQAAGQTDPTSASTINFTVVFSAVVADFATGDVTVTGTAPGTKTATVSGSGTTYNVAVSGMTGSGTVIATAAAGVAHDAAGNANTVATSTDNTVTYDVTAPTVTINQAAGQADPTGTSPINFTVVFSESVADFATGDVTVTGTAPGTKTAAVSGSGTTYNVAVSGMTGSGTVIATAAAGVAHDAAGNANTASNTASVTYDSVAPTVAVTPTGTTTSGSPITFTLTFSESVTGLTAAEVTVTNGTKGILSGSGTTYTIPVRVR
ncbi:MAG: M6 family metalloprotease domain-containing protein [Verrucomicrobia bacterium]|nr:M6 family metalloprotease domain-containing protein [Verrucomicrobiota bacterium]